MAKSDVNMEVCGDDSGLSQGLGPFSGLPSPCYRAKDLPHRQLLHTMGLLLLVSLLVGLT